MTTTLKPAWAEQYHTAQVYSNGAEVALGNSKGQQIGPFVFCKDFLHDALRSRIHATPSSIYGYQTGAAELAKIELERPYVFLANSQIPDLSAKLPNILDFMNQIDNALVKDGVLSSYQQASNPPPKYKLGGVSFWTGSPLWMVSPPAFSLWTLLLRNGHVHTIGQNWRVTLMDIIDGKLPPGVEKDHVYLKFSLPGINLMETHGIAGVFCASPGNIVPATNSKEFDPWFQKYLSKNYPSPKVMDTHTLHHWGGIVSYSDTSAKKAFGSVTWKWPQVTEKAPAYCHH